MQSNGTELILIAISLSVFKVKDYESVGMLTLSIGKNNNFLTRSICVASPTNTAFSSTIVPVFVRQVLLPQVKYFSVAINHQGLYGHVSDQLGFFFSIVSCNIVISHCHKNSMILSQIIAALNDNVVEIHCRSSLGRYFYIDM